MSQSELCRYCQGRPQSLSSWAYLSRSFLLIKSKAKPQPWAVPMTRIGICSTVSVPVSVPVSVSVSLSVSGQDKCSNAPAHYSCRYQRNGQRCGQAQSGWEMRATSADWLWSTDSGNNSLNISSCLLYWFSLFGFWFSIFLAIGQHFVSKLFFFVALMHLPSQFEKWASDKLCPLSKRAEIVKVDVDEVEANCRAGKTLSHSLSNAPAYVTQRGGGWWCSSVLACSLL